MEVACKPRDGGARVDADVRDNGDGTYALTAGAYTRSLFNST